MLSVGTYPETAETGEVRWVRIGSPKGGGSPRLLSTRSIHDLSSAEVPGVVVGAMLGGERKGETRKEEKEMKLTKKSLMAVALFVAFAMVASPMSVGGHDPPPECVENDEVILWAGQNIDVGTVFVWHDNVYLYVKYILDDDENGCGWYITESHLSVVVGTYADHPQGKKNLKLGHFEFTEPTDEGDKFHLYIISWDDIDGFDWDGTSQKLDIVAHAVVKKVCNGETVQGETAYGDGDPHWNNWAMSFSYTPCEYKMPSIPTGTVRYKVYHPGSSTDSYFRTVIYAGAGGDVPAETDLTGWCIDLGHTINSNTYYSGELSMPSPGDDDFCKWSKVNWILNNKPSDDWEVIQAAIWNIWLGTPITSNPGSCVSLNAAQIIAATNLANEASTKCWFRAFEGDGVAVILTPLSSNQITIIEIDP